MYKPYLKNEKVLVKEGDKKGKVGRISRISNVGNGSYENGEELLYYVTIEGEDTEYNVPLDYWQVEPTD